MPLKNVVLMLFVIWVNVCVLRASKEMIHMIWSRDVLLFLLVNITLIVGTTKYVPVFKIAKKNSVSTLVPMLFVDQTHFALQTTTI